METQGSFGRQDGPGGDLNKITFDDIKHTLRGLEVLFEVAVLTVIYYTVWFLAYDNDNFPTYMGRGKYLLMLVYAVLLLVIFYLSDGFKFGHLKLFDVVVSQWIALCIVDAVTYFQLCLIANHMVSFLPILALLAVDVLVSIGCVSLFTAVYHRFYVPRNMVMVYGNDNAVGLKFKMDARSDKYRITKLCSVENSLDEICNEIQKHDAVIINDVPAQVRNDLLKYCYEHNVRAYVVPKLSDIIIQGADCISLFDTPLFLVKGEGLSIVQRAIKRLLGLMLCLAAMVPGLPVMLIVAAAIWAEDRGPVFYRQERVTKDGKVFRILKFRSMVVDAEKDGISVPASGNDPRITKVGKVIRATRIDELPQLVNIIRGDMAIVGPRPERVEHVKAYSAEIPEFHYREKVKGGLTGYAQIYGKYNTSAYDKLRLDLMYIENYSLLLDIKLIIMTLQIMVRKESTEGFDASEALEEKRKELLSKGHLNMERKSPKGIGTPKKLESME